MCYVEELIKDESEGWKLLLLYVRLFRYYLYI
jgi:hypothetical protein